MPPIQRQFLYSITVIKLQLFIEPPFYYYRVLRPFFCFLRLITLFGTTFCSSFPPARRDLPLPNRVTAVPSSHDLPISRLSFPPARRDLPLPNLTAVPSSHDLPISRLSLSPAPGPAVFLPASRFFLHRPSALRLPSSSPAVVSLPGFGRCFGAKICPKSAHSRFLRLPKSAKQIIISITKYDFVTF